MYIFLLRMPFFTVPAFGIGWIIAIVFIVGFSLILQLARNWNVEIDKVEEEIEDPIILKITLPQNNNSTIEDAKSLFAMLHGIIGGRSKSYYHFSFEFSQSSYGTQFYVVTPPKFKTFVINQIYATYPHSEITETLDYSAGVSARNIMDLSVMVADVDLAKDYIFPLKITSGFSYDSLSALIATSGTLNEHEMLSFQLLLRPVGAKWQKTGRMYLDNLRKGLHPKGKRKFRKDFVKVLTRLYEGAFSIRHLTIKPAAILDKSQLDEIAQIEDKISLQGYEFLIRILVVSKSDERSYDLSTSIVSSLSQFNSPHLNSLQARYYTKKNKEELETQVHAYRTRQLEIEANDILSIGEIANIYHFPNEKVTATSIAWTRAKKSEPPTTLPTSSPLIGKTDYRDTPKVFGINEDDRRRHMYILGKTGSGKSTMIKQMIIQDIADGKGVGVIDPHGELAEEILAYIPAERIKDVVYMDPADPDFSPSLNLFDNTEPHEREYIASAILEVFKKHFDSWGPRLEYILHNTILSLLYVKGSTMFGIQRMLTDYSYRKYVLSHISDPVLKRFWEEEYTQIERNSRVLAETIAPIQNKVGRFLTSGSIRRLVCQSEGKIQLEKILADKKILICNLSQGKLGEENSSMLGSLIVTRIQSAAMARVRLLDSQRPDFYLYVDEFQNFATTSFMKILSEARKYKLNLIIAHQYLGQVTSDMQQAILGNIGTLVCFMLGVEDAQNLEKEFFPVINAHDLTSLEKYKFYIKMLVDGFFVRPFSAQTFIMEFDKTSDPEVIKSESRKKYSKPIGEVDEELKEWNTKIFYNTFHENSKESQDIKPLSLFPVEE